jgi:hypothetical protein
MAPGEKKHGRIFGWGQPSFHVIDHGSLFIQQVQVGGPDRMVLDHQFSGFVDIDLHRNKIFIEQSRYIKIRVRHGTQFGAPPSPFLEKIQEDRLSLLAGTLLAFRKRILPFHPGFELFHLSAPFGFVCNGKAKTQPGRAATKIQTPASDLRHQTKSEPQRALRAEARGHRGD